ncbi:immunity 22 family protein [Paenibacillus cisolokensis]|jgi:hypothetical protein|uniref:Immunity protein 22 n=1 Tax=Paenibacillus cisolokensis TaxID=1658519 RepID=A0ABQ4N1W7_9BACL|nr:MULTISPECIES: immunity 22 family protein [Paenibacillus]ALS26322.1 immunity protein 22 [Paenibacillus sp. 32O-W]GIQ62171.1 hypothetical protein PACILC2_07390 [Paenibacillus cisolokensis]
MKHVVTVWGANFRTEEELRAFVEPVSHDDGETLPSEFMTRSGIGWFDADFMETHFINSDEERRMFIAYMHRDYSPHEQFAEHLPATLYASIGLYNSIILLYGNDSPSGAVNEQLFRIARSGAAPGSSAILVAGIEYET